MIFAYFKTSRIQIFFQSCCFIFSFVGEMFEARRASKISRNMLIFRDFLNGFCKKPRKKIARKNCSQVRFKAGPPSSHFSEHVVKSEKRLTQAPVWTQFLVCSFARSFDRCEGYRICFYQSRIFLIFQFFGIRFGFRSFVSGSDFMLHNLSAGAKQS